LEEATLFAQTTYPLSPATKARLASGGTFLWIVDAPTVRLGPHWFEVRAASEDPLDTLTPPPENTPG
jgi:hypothetical protein